MPSDVGKSLHAALRRHRVVRLEVTDNIGAAPFGVPVVLSAELVVIHFLRDFRLDGYAAVPRERIGAVHVGPFERSYTHLCAAEGILDKLSAPPHVDATTWIGLCSDLRRLGRYTLLNHISVIDGELSNLLTIGPLTGISDTAVATRAFDATGRWSRAAVAVRFEDLLDIQWSSRYIRVWQRHNPLPLR